MSMIELRGISKAWGDAVALHAIDLRIAPASFCVLLGPSGCGKSTTLRIIAGLETATAGQVLIGGADVTHRPPSQRGIAMVFQNYALFPHLSVAENIGFGLAVRKTPKAEARQRVEEAAALLGLSQLLQRKPGQLSGGQQQRVALGRALVARASVCLMDEPLSNLDAQLRQEMRHELRELQQRLGLTVVYVTHDQTEAMSMADQVVLLSQGRIEQNDAPRRAYARPASLFAARFIGTPPMNLLRLDAQGHILGSAVATGAPAGAAHLGVRPECVRLAPADQTAALRARVLSFEYLGADLVLRCEVGSEALTLRVDGQQNLQVGDELALQCAAGDLHFFDATGRRMDTGATAVPATDTGDARLPANAALAQRAAA
ncbi:ABC transporter ATP-binding protein [Corticibacter populi]|uniref:ABC transporter ATP-binding protein n=1 Tax=Corticibacter populi TaxID=1550736 RepID=A0A3M6QTN6_9BURK|nr:ABC transporter ATP-binding protein [Corticibacter populi]RMX06343.1 ABC transporter ATP-binding protein [Corticibacter populi]RZS32115.1 carbohydrate ABC transporter ATP-binding protein (CUT1 family) [Corticibacter populi]